MFPPVVYALGSNLFFATASIVFAEFSKKNSTLWMNSFKAVIATAAFALTVTVAQLWMIPAPASSLLLLLSGAIGLMVGDMFLLKAFTLIGPSRTLMIFGFQPIILGLSSLFLFNQGFPLYRLFAVVCMILCLFTFSLENYRKNKHWQMGGLLAGLMGVLLDACGILMTRQAFEMTPEMSPILGNWIRCMGALFGFALVHFFYRRIHFKRDLIKWPKKTQTKIILASLAGTYFSLMLYLTALKSGHLASISAIAITSPTFAALFECIKNKRWPTKYLLTGLVFFITGFLILLN